MRSLYIFLFLLVFLNVFAQEPCKKIVFEVCIDGRSRLHIKSGALFWQHLSDEPPGVHEECVGETKINGVIWKDWQKKFSLSFNTDNSSLESKVIQKHDISMLLQSPSAKNGWESIWEFNDPSGSPHYYSVSFEFCTVKKDSPKKVKKETTEPVKKDTIKPKEQSIDLPSFYKIYFESSKAVLTIISEKELSIIYDNLKNNNTLVEIFGYQKNENDRPDALKLYNERALVICNYLMTKGLDQKRIQYIGYGDKNTASEKNKKRIELKILE